ncbi:hypothetical protein BKA56DRAFT_571465 [Ilyonectria sp. MPI-CAGE-AT-0026]|nr:hypothetical protein BKA56DRAFT_571465 [Ilyonectria sp. MPI-CAGE-AT-0026]
MLRERLQWKGGKYLRTKRSEKNSEKPEHRPTGRSDVGVVGGKVAGGRGVGGGSGLRSKIIPLLSSWFQPHRKYNLDECFFPFPKITFLIDKPTKLRCQICREVECEMKPETLTVDDSTLSILPCGHGAGSECLKRWLQVNNSCPFCRLSMTYPGCGHVIPLRPVTTEGIHLLPRTLPDQGHIPLLCAGCLRDSLAAQAELRFGQAACAFQDARQRLHEGGGVEDEEALLMRREEFETILRDEVYMRQLTTWLTSW